MLAKEMLENEGPAMQLALQDYAKTQKSYIEEFWDDLYLEFDAPLPLNVNPIFILEDDPTPTRSKAIPRLTSLIYSSLKFVRAVRQQSLPPDKWKKGTLCMDQYQTLFGSSRVPGKVEHVLVEGRCNM